MSEAITSNSSFEDIPASNPTTQADGTYYYTALFWHSPFAMAAGVVIITQMLLLGLAYAADKPPSLLTTLPFILIATMMLVVGIMPLWNCLKLTDDGLEQHAGLTKISIAWENIHCLEVFQHWIEIHTIITSATGEQSIKIVRILNRYGLPSDALSKQINEKWQKASQLAL